MGPGLQAVVRVDDDLNAVLARITSHAFDRVGQERLDFGGDRSHAIIRGNPQYLRAQGRQSLCILVGLLDGGSKEFRIIAAERILAVAEYRSEEVVELMRENGRDGPERGHPLELLNLLLQVGQVLFQAVELRLDTEGSRIIRGWR